MGLAVELLSGEEEAAMAGYGVLAAIPGADGIVGDLGGGSLELVRVGGGEVHERVSFPLGVLRIGAIRAEGPRALDRARRARRSPTPGGTGAAQGLPFYLVGGSWRALARLDMHLTGYPLPIIHHYRMAPDGVGAAGAHAGADRQEAAAGGARSVRLAHRRRWATRRRCSACCRGGSDRAS